MGVIRGYKEERVADGRQVMWTRAIVARLNVLDKHRARKGAVAAPQFLAADAVRGAEEQRSAHVRQVKRRPLISRVDVLDEDGSRRRAVGLPQLRPADTVVGCKEED